MAEGLSASEVGKEIGEHKHASESAPKDRRDRVLSVTEALLRSLVAVLAAYSGYAAAQWGTYSSVSLAKATVLFLVGISGHFPLRQARYGLIGVGALMLAFAVVQLLGLPGPP